MPESVITMAHGAGGLDSQRLFTAELLPLLAPEHAACLEDAAHVMLSGNGDGSGHALVVTTDGFTVRPLIFPGGDIGKLAVCGTVNDLAMRGATPAWLTVSMILEEGLGLGVLRQVVSSMRAAVAEVGAGIVAGDTKVVERGHGHGMYLAVTGVGRPLLAVPPGVRRARARDRVIINGPVGNHGLAVLSAREDLGFTSAITSDCAPLCGLVETMLQAGGTDVHTLRDPTRGGVAATLNEIAAEAGVGIVLAEEAIPVDPAVRSACDILGFDPLTIANEGKLLALVAAGSAERVLAAMREHPLGRSSAVIGEVNSQQPGRVVLQTALGTRRLVDVPSGELLPRIC